MSNGRWGEYDQLKHNEGITNHVPIAPPPHPAPEELMEEQPVNGVAFGGDGSDFTTSGARDVDDTDPPARRGIGKFGTNQQDYRLNDTKITASWAQASPVDDHPAPVRESASDSRILGESVRGAVRVALPAEHGSTLWEAARLLVVCR
jgi:hypothetical protein